MFDEETRAASQANLDGLRRRVRRPRRVDQHRDRRVPAAAARHRPGDAEPVRRRRPTCARFVGELGDAAAIVAPAAETQARAVRATSTPRSRALREVARPYIQDSITERQARARRRRSRASRSSGRSWPTPRACSASCSPAPRALRTAAPTLADALVDGIAVLPRTPPFNRRLASLLDELQTFADDPLVPRGHRRHDRARSSRCSPTLAYLAPAQTVCNYLTLFFRNISSLLSEGDRNGTWQRFIIVATPQGPNNEGGPSSGARQRADARTTTCTPTRTRTRRRPASRASARRATSRTCAGRTVIGEPAAARSRRATEGNAPDGAARRRRSRGRDRPVRRG